MTFECHPGSSTKMTMRAMSDKSIRRQVADFNSVVRFAEIPDKTHSEHRDSPDSFYVTCPRSAAKKFARLQAIRHLGPVPHCIKTDHQSRFVRYVALFCTKRDHSLLTSSGIFTRERKQTWYPLGIVWVLGTADEKWQIVQALFSIEIGDLLCSICVFGHLSISELILPLLVTLVWRITIYITSSSSWRKGQWGQAIAHVVCQKFGSVRKSKYIAIGRIGCHEI